MKSLLLALAVAVVTARQAGVLPVGVPGSTFENATADSPRAWAWLAGWTAPVAAAGVTFSGTVSGNDQGFLKGAMVSIEGPVKKEATTDADGRFSIVGVEAGKYQVQVMADGYLPVNQPMQVGTASVSVDILLLKLAGL